jgi:tellurite resistance protein TerC
VIGLWAGFVAFVLVMMVLDLKFVGRKKGQVSIKLALAWTGVCVALALAFVPAVYVIYEQHLWGMGVAKAADLMGPPTPEGIGPGARTTGLTAASWFLQGWLLEYSLSVDNIFVFAVIFRHFQVPDKHQHRVLAWGIIAALVLRGVMIGLGTFLVAQFDWLLYVAALFLLYTAWSMVRGKDEEYDPEKSVMLRTARRLFPITDEFHGDHFFVRQTHLKPPRWAATPMLLVLVVLNVVDIVFALDSIPAILGITTDPFIVFTSNVFAILGLRSLYFVLAGMMHKFKYLNVSLAVILAFVGVKMLLHHPIPGLGIGGIEISGPVSLGVIVASLATGVVMSIRADKARPSTAAAPGPNSVPGKRP